MTSTGRSANLSLCALVANRTLISIKTWKKYFKFIFPKIFEYVVI